MNYTQEQIEKQFDLLPEEVQGKLFTSEIESKVEKIVASAGAPFSQIKKLNTLVNFVILGLTEEREFVTECQKTFPISADDAKELWKVLDREVFAPIEAVRTTALEEKARYDAEEKELFEETSALEKQTTPADKPRVQMTDVAPDNLPTGETESFLPNLAPKTATESEEPTHPFEEKMKRVFTAGQQSMSDLAIEPAPQAPLEVAKAPSVPLPPTGQVTVAQVPKAPPAKQADPYREAIE